MSARITSEAQGARVLVIDDDRGSLNALKRALRLHFEVLAADSGQAGLEIAGGPDRPELILLDVMMPVMSGYQVLERLQANPQTKRIPVIFITGMDTEDDEAQGLKMGAVDYVTKPYKPSILVARISTHLALKRAQDELARQKELHRSEAGRRAHAHIVAREEAAAERLAAEQVVQELSGAVRESACSLLAAAEQLRASSLAEAQRRQVKIIVAHAAGLLKLVEAAGS
jgi:putative two-component system response regulator